MHNSIFESLREDPNSLLESGQTDFFLLFPQSLDHLEKRDRNVVLIFCLIAKYKKEIINELKLTWEKDKEMYQSLERGDSIYISYPPKYLERMIGALTPYAYREEHSIDFSALVSLFLYPFDNIKNLYFIFEAFGAHKNLTIIQKYLKLLTEVPFLTRDRTWSMTLNGIKLL